MLFIVHGSPFIVHSDKIATHIQDEAVALSFIIRSFGPILSFFRMSFLGISREKNILDFPIS